MAQLISYDNRPAADKPLPSYQGQIVRHFTPNWFATTMGTGILSVGLAQIPSQPLLFEVGQTLWLLNILLFATCCALYTARWLLFPHEAVRIFWHPVASMFFGCIPMGIATIINGFLIYGPGQLGELAHSIAAGGNRLATPRLRTTLLDKLGSTYHLIPVLSALTVSML